MSKESSNAGIYIVMFVYFCALMMSTAGVWKEARETNKLLSTFQRIDTVKEVKNHWFCFYEGTKGKRFCVNSDAATSAVFPDKPGDEVNLNDPNRCVKWISNCTGKECDIICKVKSR